MENKTYAEKLVELRKNKGVSRAEVAKAVGVSKSAIVMYELGERMPRDSVKRSIAKYYGKSINFIFFS